MPAAPPFAPPLDAEHTVLTIACQASVVLRPIGDDIAGPLAAAITSIDPWKRMSYRPEAMATYLGAREPGACRRAILHDDQTVGAVSIRYPWLRGPYLELLALLPGSQGLGIGAAVLDWMAAEVAGRANSLWVCTSTFNARALSFYERNGFARVGDLDGLVGPGYTEILLRRKL